MNKKILFLVNILVLLTSFVLCADLGEHSLDLAAAYGCNNPSFPNACISGGTVTCLNLQTNNNNCGTCGNVCPTGVNCASGTCGTCPIAGQIVCGGQCIATSSTNCGTCGNTCSATEFCSGTGATASCTSLGFSVNACTTDASTGTGATDADLPITVLVSGTHSISANQCNQYCTQISTAAPTFFTLYTDTFSTGTAGSSASVNTYCNCYYTGTAFDTTTSGTCTANGFGTTSNGVGSWEVYTIG
jgi:hypothetical protein